MWWPGQYRGNTLRWWWWWSGGNMRTLQCCAISNDSWLLCKLIFGLVETQMETTNSLAPKITCTCNRAPLAEVLYCVFSIGRTRLVPIGEEGQSHYHLISRVQHQLTHNSIGSSIEGSQDFLCREKGEISFSLSAMSTRSGRVDGMCPFWKINFSEGVMRCCGGACFYPCCNWNGFCSCNTTNVNLRQELFIL